MRAAYANCFGAPPADLLITNERSVAAATAADTLIADELVDSNRAEALNAHVTRLAFDWPLRAGSDPSIVEGLSAADLAGGETLMALLMPAARGILEADAVLAHALPDAVELVTPTGATHHYRRHERIQAEAFAATLTARTGGRITVARRTVDDPRNGALVAKYAMTRDPPLLPPRTSRGRRRVEAACAAVNAMARARRDRRDRAFVLEYHPTAAFARRRSTELPLVRSGFPVGELRAVTRRGDRALPPLAPTRDGERLESVAASVRELGARAACAEAFTIDGVELWPVLATELAELVAEYAAWLRSAAPRVADSFRRGRVQSLLVPYDTPPFARLLVRAAQARRIPAFVLNDGWKGDDFSVQGMTADVPLATSAGVLEDYFSRHPNAARGVLTGDPRADEHQPRTVRAVAPPERVGTVLIGSFTFSPIDLNCRRSDSERFLEDTLVAVRSAYRTAAAEIVVKLHPADDPHNYRQILARYDGSPLHLVTGGDVTELFDRADLYITTYSTSLLQAALAGVPFIYYAVNPQRLHPPFHPADAVMGARIAHTPDQLRALLDGDAARALPPEAELRAWIERHVGPTDGRCTDRVEAVVWTSLHSHGS